MSCIKALLAVYHDGPLLSTLLPPRFISHMGAAIFAGPTYGLFSWPGGGIVAATTDFVLVLVIIRRRNCIRSDTVRDASGGKPARGSLCCSEIKSRWTAVYLPLYFVSYKNYTRHHQGHERRCLPKISRKNHCLVILTRPQVWLRPKGTSSIQRESQNIFCSGYGGL